VLSLLYDGEIKMCITPRSAGRYASVLAGEWRRTVAANAELTTELRDADAAVTTTTRQTQAMLRETGLATALSTSACCCCCCSC